MSCNQSKKEKQKEEIKSETMIEKSENFDWLLGKWKRLNEEEEKDLLDGKMSTSGWVTLMVSALLMLLGVINLFGIEEIALAAASTLFN